MGIENLIQQRLHNNAKSMSKKYYLQYLRKSSESDERQVQSLKDQEKENDALVKREGLNVLKTFSESRSAKQPGREEFNKMLGLISQRDDIKGIVAWHFNRLSRNPIDTGTLQWLLQQGKIEEIVTTQKTYRAEDSALLMAIEGGVSNQFILDLKKATKRGIDSKISKGIAPMLAPPGYYNDTSKPQGQRDIQPHPEHYPLMRKLFELFMSGNYSVSKLTEVSEDLGIKNSRDKEISESQMHKILSNPFYTGRFIYSGELHDGIHKQMLTDSEFELIQEILNDNSRPRPSKPLNFPLRGFIKCGRCGMSITGERHTKKYKSGKKQTFRYYRCTKKNKELECDQSYVRAEELEKQTLSFLQTIEIDPDFSEWAIEWCNFLNSQEKEAESAHKSKVQKEYDEAVEEIENLVDLKISSKNRDGSLLSEEDYSIKRKKLVKKRDDTLEKLEKLNERTDEWDNLTIKTFNFASKAREKFENGDFETKQLILKGIGSNLSLLNGKLEITPRMPFLIIKEYLQGKSNRLEPDKKALLSGEVDPETLNNFYVGE